MPNKPRQSQKTSPLKQQLETNHKLIQHIQVLVEEQCQLLADAMRRIEELEAELANNMDGMVKLGEVDDSGCELEDVEEGKHE